MGKYQNDARDLLKHVGGKDNIGAVTHCVTRMRFVLNHPDQAEIEAIEKIPAVKGTFTQAGQFQVIIGNDVDLFYNDFVEISGVEGTTKEGVKTLAKTNQGKVQQLMSNLAEIFAPLIPALIIGGLILGFRNILEGVTWGEWGKIVDNSQFWAGINHFLWLIGEAIFQFLPVGITWSISRKMGTTQILGIVLGITLVSPQLMNAYEVAGATAIPFWDFGFAQVQMIGYQAQVIPAMLAGFTLVYLERFWKKIIPSAVSMIFVPLFALVPAVLIAHVVLGPIGWTIGSWISNVVYSGLTSSFRILFAGIFGFFYAPLVLTGLHHMSNAIDMQLVNDFGGTLLWPMIAFSNIAQGSAVLGIWWLHRGNTEEEQVSIPSIISAYLGVTEPAMFGINLKYNYPFIAAMIGSSIAAVISVGFGLMANSIGVGGLPGFLSFNIDRWPLFFMIALVVIIVPFVITVAYGRKVEGNAK
ncbi:PTS system trehalose-specific EIIBC component [Erysipelothrix sp. HDW6B]|uniref:PTS system trehalose-specific EIIBC component n=1 Tax=Erysipelothrix TaxID=1647 RepID=UPI0013586D6C|nr:MULTISPECIES: PTS system trehalose-specific EIIBC component [Erysipelothrix]QIK85349.1 PTS system trehalose-specific EIIBC component [Erysipelothrix sp. HDW6B]